ncbi:MAG TPA: hypothetical protein VF841_10905, partial [Anaeromyxobacter sp.]
ASREAGPAPTPVPGATPVFVLTPSQHPAPPRAASRAPPREEPAGPVEPEGPAAVEPREPPPSGPPAVPESSFASILDEAIADEAEPEPAAPPPRPPAEGTESLEPLYGTGEPTPAPQAPPAGKGGSLPAASRRAMLIATTVAAILGLAILAYAVARRPAAPLPDPAAVAADAEAQIASRISSADRRISEGRLSGPDGALEHLLAASALRPADARVKDRLRLLADTLEMLGARALERGDAAEAEVHLSAAKRAAPDRRSIASKLEAAAKMSAASAAGSQPDAGDGAR